jgi:transcriptional/translational regulatory protein YebC/TACO1
MAEITMKAATHVDLTVVEAEKVMRMVDMLEDLDDVQNVYSNAEFSDEVIAQLG